MPTELFITHCTTCRARLKVYDQDAIGQILSCPKCGSMVLVAAPPDWTPPVAAAAVVGASPTSPQPAAKVVAKAAAAPAPPAAALGVPGIATQKATRAPASPASTTSSPPQLPTPQMSTNGRAATAAGAASGLITVTNPVLPPPLQASVSPATNAAAGGLDAGMSAGRWSAIAARLRQDWWMLAGGFLAGVVVGGGVWLAVLLSGDHSTGSAEKVVVAPNAALPAGQTTAVDVDQAAGHSAVADTNDGAEQAGRHSVDKPAVEAAVDTAPLKPFPTKKPTSDEDSAAETPADESAATEGADVEQTAESPAEALPVEGDAADLLGGQLLLPQDMPPDDSPVAVEKQDDGDKPNGKQAADADDVAAEPQPENTQQEIAAERLAGVLPPLDFEQVALNKFVTFLGQYTTVTIKIDRAALQKAGIDYKAPVTVKRANTTVAQALRDALGPLGLTYRLDKDTLLITPAKRAAR